MQLYNTLTRKIEEFKPIDPDNVRMYTCGLTVYDYAHLGNLRKYIGDDILKRVLEFNGYKVKHVMNITDVGHLTSDEDAGEDKLEKGAREKGMDVWQLARYFENYFWKSLKEVNVIKPDIIPHATEHIKQQIELIQKLERKRYTYRTNEAVYFDISKFPAYADFAGQKLEDKIVGARNDTNIDPQKKHPQDFALWFFTKGRFKHHVMKWPSPWGEGFPGWHIECSAMSMAYLGETLDIHTGGVDHITVHHPNEIAQSEAATGKQFVRFWVHYEFLVVENEKMSKSKKNFYTIDDVKKKGLPAGKQGFNPLAFRYLTFLTHYRTQMNFTWKALGSAQAALDKIYELAAEFGEPKIARLPSPSAQVVGGQGCAQFEQEFMDTVNLDLNMPKAVSVMWEMLRSKQPSSAKAQTLLKMDEVLGLKIQENINSRQEIPDEIRQMSKEREKLRREKRFGLADQMRNKIEKMGYIIKDSEKGTQISRKI